MNATGSSSPGWELRLFGLLLGLVGLLLAMPGFYLVLLGGSWYYLLAGIGLAVAGVGYFHGHAFGAAAFAVVFAGTLVWAIWKAGIDLWPLVPRLVAPLVLAIPAVLWRPRLPAGAVGRQPPGLPRRLPSA